MAVSRHRDRLGDIGIIVVTFTDPERLGAYRTHLDVPLDVALVSDVNRDLYRCLGLERGTRRQVWSFGTLRLYARLLRSGRRLQRTAEDVRQLGADVVVDGQGVIREILRPASPDARPTVDDLATVVAPLHHTD